MDKAKVLRKSLDYYHAALFCREKTFLLVDIQQQQKNQLTFVFLQLVLISQLMERNTYQIVHSKLWPNNGQNETLDTFSVLFFWNVWWEKVNYLIE